MSHVQHGCFHLLRSIRPPHWGQAGRHPLRIHAEGITVRGVGHSDRTLGDSRYKRSSIWQYRV